MPWGMDPETAKKALETRKNALENKPVDTGKVNFPEKPQEVSPESDLGTSKKPSIESQDSNETSSVDKDKQALEITEELKLTTERLTGVNKFRSQAGNLELSQLKRSVELFSVRLEEYSKLREKALERSQLEGDSQQNNQQVIENLDQIISTIKNIQEAYNIRLQEEVAKIKAYSEYVIGDLLKTNGPLEFPLKRLKDELENLTVNQSKSEVIKINEQIEIQMNAIQENCVLISREIADLNKKFDDYTNLDPNNQELIAERSKLAAEMLKISENLERTKNLINDMSRQGVVGTNQSVKVYERIQNLNKFSETINYIEGLLQRMKV